MCIYATRHESEERGQVDAEEAVDWGALCCYPPWYKIVTMVLVYVDFWGNVMNGTYNATTLVPNFH